MTEPSSITTLIGDEPFNARRVVKFNPLDKSFTEIGPDFGEGGYKWMCGVRDNRQYLLRALSLQSNSQDSYK